MVTSPQLTENAVTILRTRYLQEGETPEGLFRRVANAIAAPETEQEFWADQFYDLMADCVFMPNSPTLFNAGTGAGTLSACFVIPVEDTMDSIMHAATVSAMIQKYGGGIGYSFGRLRSRGAQIKTTQGRACGAVAVLKMLSSLSDMITQGGKRHGANMGILGISHPEIKDFIHMKDDDKTAQNFNISIAITDDFMKAVENDENWDLIVPQDSEAKDAGTIIETVKARELWQDIISSAWKTGDPGLYFIDEANRTNPTPHIGNLDSTNPCGEVPLLANEACNLGSIDLGKFIKTDEDGNTSFDFQELESVSRTAARFLDDVVSINQFPTTKVKEAVDLTRKTGLGVMGWHDCLIRLGIDYDSEEALTLGSDVMQCINDAARDVSINLAKDRGAYPGWQVTEMDPNPIRNATRTCIAPTGTISAIAGASSGIEPIFALAFVKNVLDGRTLTEVNVDFERVAKERGFYSEDLMAEVAKTGSCQDIEGIPDDVKKVFKVANEIPVDTHVRMQAAFQKHTDLAVSKTINMANSATEEDVERAYWLAYWNKCKGITIYRDGSKSMQVLEVQKDKSSNDETTNVSTSGGLTPKQRPQTMRGITEKIHTGSGNTYITLNFDEEGLPFEVFATLGKAGSIDSANLEAVSRLVSLALRSGIAMESVIDELQGITCNPVWDQGVLVRSVPDALAHVLRKYTSDMPNISESNLETAVEQLGLPLKAIANSETPASVTPIRVEAVGFSCPECSSPVTFQEGCVMCHYCAWTQCGG